MTDALRVLAIVGLLGVFSLPIARALFGSLPGAGAGIARPLGLLLGAFAVWLLVSLGVIDYGTGAAWFGVALVVVAGSVLFVLQRRAGTDEGPPPGTRALLVGAEVVFVVFFVLGAVLRSYAPDIVGTEQPMDMMYLNAVNTSSEFPPHDLWLAGEDVNYYYFGSYLMAFVVKLAGLAPDRGYNLSLALLFGLSASAVFGLAGAMAAGGLARAGEAVRRVGLRAVLAGLGATVFTILAGNFNGTKLVLFDREGPLKEMSWFDASRVTPGGINDFPFFATILGDLHAHLIAVPFTVVGVAFALHVFLRGPLDGSRAAAAARTVAAAISVGALYAMHSWSYPVVLGLVVLAALAWGWRALGEEGRRGLAVAAGWAVAVAVLSYLVFLPFFTSFDPGTKGTGIVEDRLPFGRYLGQLGLIHGATLGLALLALALRAAPPAGGRRRAVALGVFGVAVVLVVVTALAGDTGPVVFVVVLLAFALYAASRRDRSPAEGFFFLLVAAGLGCVVIPEVVYVRDAFEGGEYFRMNTVFKFGFNAWLLFGLASGGVLAWAWGWLPKPARPVFGVAVALLAAASLVFTVGGAVARTGGFPGPARLDGMGWLETIAPGDVKAIEWIRANTSEDDVVLEAAGPEYSYGGRIATFTGRPTVIEWAGHEIVWGQDIGTREGDVQLVYTSPDATTTASLLEKYSVDYVVVAGLERSTYPELDADKFDQLGEKVFTSGETTIYRVGEVKR